jgi:hypothetical protein
MSQTDRRGYLRWLGAAGTGSLAGCSLLEDETGQSAGEFQLRPGDHLAIAVGKLNVIALAVRELQETDDPRTATFDQERPRERLAAAREAIGAAEGPSDEVEPADVTAVVAYATSLEATVDTIVELLSANRALEETEETLGGAETDVAAVRESLERATATSASAVEHHGRAVTASDSADEVRLAALDAEIEAVSDGLQTLSGYVTGVDRLSRGYSRYLDGVEAVQRADDAVADESFGEASDAFERAAESFDASEVRFAETSPDEPDPVAAELEVGKQRSLVLGRLSTGYVSLLDGRSKLDAAATAYEQREFDTARQAVRDGQQAAQGASNQFDMAGAAETDEFDGRLETANRRASALESLSAGYVHLLDASESLQEGESALVEEDSDTAAQAFATASEKGRAATERFTAVEGGDLVAGAFEPARDRATAVTALAEGYGTVVEGLRDLETGRNRLDDRAFNAAAGAFQSGSGSFAAATETFQTGREAAPEEFTDEFERALCQAGHLSTAAGHFETAAAAGSDGDRAQLRNETADAEAARDRIERC